MNGLCLILLFRSARMAKNGLANQGLKLCSTTLGAQNQGCFRSSQYSRSGQYWLIEKLSGHLKKNGDV